jgi:hypothetical protein
MVVLFHGNMSQWNEEGTNPKVLVSVDYGCMYKLLLFPDYFKLKFIGVDVSRPGDIVPRSP